MSQSDVRECRGRMMIALSTCTGVCSLVKTVELLHHSTRHWWEGENWKLYIYKDKREKAWSLDPVEHWSQTEAYIYFNFWHHFLEYLVCCSFIWKFSNFHWSKKKCADMFQISLRYYKLFPSFDSAKSWHGCEAFIFGGEYLFWIL